MAVLILNVDFRFRQLRSNQHAKNQQKPLTQLFLYIKKPG